MEKHPNILAAAVIALGIVSISTAALFIRYAQSDGVPSLIIAAARMVIAALFMAPFVLLRNRSEIRTIDRRTWLLLSASGLLLAIHMACWVASLELTSVVTSVVVVTSAPLWVGLFTVLFLKEKIRSSLIIGMAIALCGGVIIGVNQYLANTTAGNMLGTRISPWGIALALIGAVCSAGYLVIGRAVRKTLSLGVYICIVYGISGVFLVIAATGSPLSLRHLPRSALLWIVLLAVIPQLIGHSSFNWALKHYSPVLVSIALLGEPVGAGVLALIFLQEIPTWLEGVGAGLILIGIAVAIVSEKPPGRMAASPSSGSGSD